MTVRRPEATLEPGLVLERLSAGYGESHVLKNLALTLPAGKVSALLGPGGSGKTTLVRILSGVQDAGLWSRGTVRTPPGALAVLSQLPTNSASPSGSLGLAGNSRQLRESIASVWGPKTAATDELLPLLDQDPPSWQPWQRQLLRFTEVCDRRAKMYVLDEPDTNAPARTLSWLAAKARELAADAVVLVVTHNLHFARLAADHVAILVEGSLVESGAADQIFNHPQHPRAQQYLRMGS